MKFFLIFIFTVLISPLVSYADTRIITVAKQGGDFSNIVDAVNSITDAESNNRYVVSVGPGLFFLNGQQINMKPFVSLVGAGENSTFIQSFAVSSSSLNTGCGVISLVGDSTVESLTIQNIGVDAGSTLTSCGLEVRVSGRDRMVRNVRVIVRGRGREKIGLLNRSSIDQLENVSILVENFTGDATGIELVGPILDASNVDVRIRASAVSNSIGVLLDTGSINLDGGSIVAGDFAITTRGDIAGVVLNNVSLVGEVAYLESFFDEPLAFTTAARMNNIRTSGIFDFNNNPNTRVTNSEFTPRVGTSEVIVNDIAGKQCSNVVGADLELIDC